ncbi:MAG: hypothetical protein U0798_19745 [Gemmataceae bacterium]
MAFTALPHADTLGTNTSTFVIDAGADNIFDSSTRIYSVYDSHQAVIKPTLIPTILGNGRFALVHYQITGKPVPAPSAITATNPPIISSTLTVTIGNQLSTSQVQVPVVFVDNLINVSDQISLKL